MTTNDWVNLWGRVILPAFTLICVFMLFSRVIAQWLFG